MKITSAIVLCAISGFAAAPRDWKTGTLVETVQKSFSTGGGSMAIAQNNSGSYAGAAANAAMASAVAANAPRTWLMQRFTIEGSGYRYKVKCRIGKHGPNVTVNGPIKYAMEKGNFYILDEDGKQFEMTVMEKALMPPTTPAAPAPKLP
jgi:hypothetical protein